MILELIQKQLKIDFTSAVVQYCEGGGSNLNFDINPREFLRFAKSDYKTHDLKGYVNALSNAKRAIDCQIDGALHIFGITYDRIPSASKNIVLAETYENSDLAYKLKLIKALDFAPSGLISKTRLLRNKLEHYYQKPKKKEISEAIELAELFILSIESHTKMIVESFILTDKKNFIQNFHYVNFVDFTYNFENKEFTLKFYENNKEIQEIILNQKDVLFYPAIKLCNNIHDELDFCEALKVFLEMIKHEIPKQLIKVELI